MLYFQEQPEPAHVPMYHTFPEPMLLFFRSRSRWLVQMISVHVGQCYADYINEGEIIVEKFLSVSVFSIYFPLNSLPSPVLSMKMCPTQIQHYHFVNVNDFQIEETMP
ncbi:hypothetical protein F5146DRAFT_1005730 [Armillaria mellea]|nr:hypothetical protein F5146DRAFT_1005730 [Armillaria mellea]